MHGYHKHSNLVAQLHTCIVYDNIPYIHVLTMLPHYATISVLIFWPFFGSISVEICGEHATSKMEVLQISDGIMGMTSDLLSRRCL